MRADLALVGFGRVARRFAQLLQEQRDSLLRDHQLDCRIVGIATRSHGAIFNADGISAGDTARRGEGERPGADGAPADHIRLLAASDAPLRVVIETTTLDIQAGQPAIAHVETALDAGCHVVTANKGPVAFAYRPLMERARRAGVSFLFEGAVMDGVPIFNLVRETMPAVTIKGFRGIVNTTTQHILMALEQGEPFGTALARMQAQGIAEADPSLDIKGWDAAAKAAALANVLMDATLTPLSVEREPLDPSAAERVRKASAAGRKLRLVASATRDEQGPHAAVRLTEIEPDDLFATLPSTANALVLTTDLLGDLAMCQLSGDLTQTAYALLSDLITVRRRAGAEA